MRDNLEPASFRGISFFVQSGNMTGGQHIITHEYPNADHYNEHLNKRPREFSVAGFVIGDDYKNRAEALAQACEQGEPGLLVHPWMGTVVVSVTGYSIEWSYSDQRMAMITFNFIAEPEAKKNVIVEDNFTVVLQDTKTAALSVNNSLAALLQKTPIAYVADAAEKTIRTAFDSIKAVKNQARKSAEFLQRIHKLDAELSLLISAPADLSSAFIDLIAFGFGAGTESSPYIGQATFKDLQEVSNLFTFGSDFVDPVGASPSVLIEKQNQNAIRDSVRLSATVITGRIAADLQFTSYDQAISTQKNIADQMDSILESDISDDLYITISKLKSSVITDINLRAANLSRVQDYTPQATMPSLVLSYKLYGTISKENDLIARNNIRYPLFVNGGVPIEVLSNE
jgi:prophage DNA circulation protein